MDKKSKILFYVIIVVSVFSLFLTAYFTLIKEKYKTVNLPGEEILE